MNFDPFPTSGTANVLLGDIARKIQLSPTNYGRAAQHYEAIDRHLRRPDSGLREFVVRLYPQGSVATGTVISSKFDHDEFDIDVILELNILANSPPGLVLDELFKALNGAPGSLYHGKVTRRSRCVTVHYEDMHVDVTPAVLLPGHPDRTSIIFHANETEQSSQHYHVTANPWGFADWVEKQMPAVHYFAEAVLRKTAEPMPAQTEIDEKAMPLLALQLIKRWRNKVFEPRLVKGTAKRCPPSVLLTFYAAQNAGMRRDLLQELQSQAHHLYTSFASATTGVFSLRSETRAATGTSFRIVGRERLKSRAHSLATSPISSPKWIPLSPVDPSPNSKRSWSACSANVRPRSSSRNSRSGIRTPPAAGSSSITPSPVQLR